MARSRESMIRSPLPTILVASLAIAARDSLTSDPVAKDGSTYVVETLAAAVSRIRGLVARRACQ